MESRITIIGLGVSNVHSSAEFYEECFGWASTEQSNESIVFFKLNGILLSLYGKEALADDAGVNPEGHGFKAVSVAYNCRSEKEVDDIFAFLHSKNVNVIKEPQKVFWGGYSGYVADPDGHLWEIAFNPYLPLDSEGNIS